MSSPLPEENTLNLEASQEKSESPPNEACFKQSNHNVLEWVCVYMDNEFCLTTKAEYESVPSFVSGMAQEGKKHETYEMVKKEFDSKEEHKVGKERKSSIGCISVISRECKTEINELKALRVKIEAEKQLIDEELKYQNQTVNLNKRRELKDEDKSSTIFVIREQKEKRGKSLRKFVSNIEKSMNGSDHSFENKSKKKYRNSFMIAPHELSNKWSEDKSRAVEESFASEKKENSIKYKIDGHRMLERELNLEYEKPDVRPPEKDSKIQQKSFAISSKRPTSRSRSITNSFKSNLKEDSSNNKSSWNPPEDYKKLDAKLKLMENKLKAVEKKQKKLEEIEKIMKDETERESESSKVRESEASKYKDTSELPSKPSILHQEKAVKQVSESSEKNALFKKHEGEKVENKIDSGVKRKSFSIKNGYSTKNEVSKSIEKKLDLISLTVNYNLSEEMMKVRKEEEEIKSKEKLEFEVVELKRTIRQLRIEKIKQEDIIKTLEKHTNINHSRHNHYPESSFDFTKKDDGLLSVSGRTEKFPYSDNGNIVLGSDQKIKSRLCCSIVKNIANNSETTSTKRRESPDMEFPNQNIENHQIMSSEIKGIKRRGLIVRQIFKEEKVGKELNWKEGCNLTINERELRIENKIGPNEDELETEENNKEEKPKETASATNNKEEHVLIPKEPILEPFEEQKFHEHKMNEFQKPIIEIPQVELLESMPFLLLPTPPSIESTFNEVLEKVKAACEITETSIGNKEDLQMKKFKNCIILKEKETDKAIVWHYSGKFYIGGWNQTTSKEDSKNGDGYEFVPEKYIYRGSFENGRRNGLGIMISANGNIYKGEWRQGEKNGLGTFEEKSIGCTYVGNWKDGKKEGKGILKRSEKEFYVGEFEKSLKSGFGKEVFSNGDMYEGEYINGRFDGQGKYFWDNQSIYVGQFKNGEREGLGKWKSNYLNGDIYIGPYSKDKKEGEGRYEWDNGCVYEGGFEKDMKSGVGKMRYGDGKIVDGIWENGKMREVKKEESKRQPN